MPKTLTPPPPLPKAEHNQHLTPFLRALHEWPSRPQEPPVITSPRMTDAEFNAALKVVIRQHTAGNLDRTTTSLVVRALLAARVQDEVVRSIERSGGAEGATFHKSIVGSSLGSLRRD